MWQKEVSNERIESQGLSDGLLPHATLAHAATENGFAALLKPPNGRLGRLQRGCRRAFTAIGIEATTQQIALFCYPRQIVRGETLKWWQIKNQARAAKSLGARPAERVGQQRVWRLKAD
jgi:hypothetical protein